ncbi:hypothetical protein BN8_02847 [Fibrisoma limi BUZ 3]|uniref:Uncharacterized protein n=1 Tax=Fibrisoma limi BUZ 3 TaxID=1185876 RepID=I2GIK5_9BACT|nr:hypothetical protein BN8_02847 [Fibrisoma limi BUZ 3]
MAGVVPVRTVRLTGTTPANLPRAFSGGQTYRTDLQKPLV